MDSLEGLAVVVGVALCLSGALAGLAFAKSKQDSLPWGLEQGDTRLTLQTRPICHGPVRNLPEFPLLSKGRQPGRAERTARYKLTYKSNQFQAAAFPSTSPCLPS